MENTVIQNMILDEDQDLYRESPHLFHPIIIQGDKLDIYKAYRRSNSEMIIEGECSNQTRDFDGETVITKGIDLSYAQREGKLIWGHTPPPEINAGILPPQFVIGNILELKPFSKALYLRGLLYKGNENAEVVYNVMKNNPGKHGIGFSIEGGSIRKSAGVIQKSWLRNVAMYHNVKNFSTWADVVEEIQKAFGADAFSKAMTLEAVEPLRREDLSSTLTRQTYPGIDVLDPEEIDIKKQKDTDVRAKLERLKDYFERDKRTGKIKWKGNSFAKAYEYFVKEAGLSDEEALDLIRMVKSRVIAKQGR